MWWGIEEHFPLTVRGIDFRQVSFFCFLKRILTQGKASNMDTNRTVHTVGGGDAFHLIYFFFVSIGFLPDTRGRRQYERGRERVSEG